MRLLCLADVHLGRSPARLHPDLAGAVTELGPAAAWRRAVEVALDERVDALLLAGDLMDGSFDFFEAFSALREGVTRLAEAGIEVVAVAGNHDVDVLPRLVSAVPEVRQLGVGGRWESALIRGKGASVRVVGWSFPERWVEASPLAGGRLASALEAVDGAAGAERPAAVIGLLHADRDQRHSRYAPVSSAELAAAPVDAWLLGHIHRPGLGVGESGSARLGGYLGSLTALDPGETGARGAWLLELDERAGLKARHVPLAPLRWEWVEVDASALERADDLPNLILSGLEELERSLRSEGADPLAVGCRLRVTGRTHLRQELARQLELEPPGARPILVGGRRYFVADVRLEALPALDLRELARLDDPVGLLAARVVALGQAGSELRERLVAEARPRLEAVRRQRAYAGLEGEALSDDEVAELLEEAALRALDALLAQESAAAHRLEQDGAGA